MTTTQEHLQWASNTMKNSTTPMNPPQLFSFSFSYFSSVDWKWIEGEYLAESEESVVTAINAVCDPELRTNDNRFVSTGKRQIDTLVVVKQNPVSLPYLITKSAFH